MPPILHGGPLRVVVAGLWLAGLPGLSGCGQQESEAKTQKPAVIINDLRLTLPELQEEVATRSIAPHGAAPPAGEAPEWLNRLIERELLVREAQQQGLDRDRTFMRTMERFWKAALITRLLSRQTQAIDAGIQVYEPEIEAHYERLREEAHLRILRLATEDAANRIGPTVPDLDGGIAAVGTALLDDTGWQWETPATLDPTLAALVLATPDGHVSLPQPEAEGQWVRVAVRERRLKNLEPLAVLRDGIHRTLRQQKAGLAMEQWMADLRSRARIVIDHEAIGQLR